ncbi:hypothetical protein [Pseudomonas sp. Pseusp97]|uniref:hypothetical protein n=1 Tax=Pseudomonas sp. Pseusp97 TaxID=3243065 RepID=UPI0039A52EE3
MLFMHKGSDGNILYAACCGENPKNNDSAYYLFDDSNSAAVARNLITVFLRLDIEKSALRPMLALFFQWTLCSEFDKAQKDIYGRMKKEGMDERAKYGIRAEWRYYNNYIDLTLALYGEYLSKPTLTQEIFVAHLVLGSQKIETLLKAVTSKINEYAESTFPSENRDALVHGNYADLHPDLTWAQWVKSYSAMSTDVLVPFLYDITMSFKKVLHWSEEPMDHGRITKDNMRINVSTPNEDFYWTSRARWATVPIWAAPSYTTHLMLLVAQKAKASVEEIQAFAYGIFAYWCIKYPHTATPIHRMYGVMTAAREFEVAGIACEPSTMYHSAIEFMADGALPSSSVATQKMAKL